MRATRAYFASIGTTGLLVLAALSVLMAASALMAFEGWPGSGGAESATPVLIDPGREASAETGPARVAAAAAVAADDVAFASAGPAPGGAPAGGGDAPAAAGPPGAPPADPPPAQPGNPGGPSAPDAPQGGGGPPQPDTGLELPGGGTLLGGDGDSLTDGVADGVESTTDFLGENALRQLSPELGSLVTETGEALTDLVRGLDGTPAGRRP